MILNRTASELSNESLMFLFNEQSDFTQLNGNDEEVKEDVSEAKSGDM